MRYATIGSNETDKTARQATLHLINLALGLVSIEAMLTGNCRTSIGKFAGEVSVIGNGRTISSHSGSVPPLEAHWSRATFGLMFEIASLISRS